MFTIYKSLIYNDKYHYPSLIYSDFYTPVGEAHCSWLSINNPSLTHQTKFGNDYLVLVKKFLIAIIIPMRIIK